MNSDMIDLSCPALVLLFLAVGFHDLLDDVLELAMYLA